jgi:hypothetical protein
MIQVWNRYIPWVCIEFFNLLHRIIHSYLYYRFPIGGLTQKKQQTAQPRLFIDSCSYLKISSLVSLCKVFMCKNTLSIYLQAGGELNASIWKWY